MRATPRARSASIDMKMSTPSATSTVQSHFTSSEKTCATSAEPTSAPSTTASAIGSAISPRAANEASSMVVAVELCRIPVMPTPAMNPPMRVRAYVEIARRSCEPNARVMPVRTMRTPQSSSATLPRKVANSSVPDIIVPRLLLAPNRRRGLHDSFATIDRKCGFERELAFSLSPLLRGEGADER